MQRVNVRFDETAFQKPFPAPTRSFERLATNDCSPPLYGHSLDRQRTAIFRARSRDMRTTERGNWVAGEV